MKQSSSVPDGLVVVDKPSGFTSHDVVAKMRGIARTRRVGHAGTLDPMATGVLVLGVERATKLLGHLALTEKEREVFGAVFQGMSNTEIGAQVFASESTVKTHVGAILRKLGLRDRVQIVVFAHQHGLVRG